MSGRDVESLAEGANVQHGVGFCKRGASRGVAIGIGAVASLVGAALGVLAVQAIYPNFGTATNQVPELVNSTAYAATPNHSPPMRMPITDLTDAQKEQYVDAVLKMKTMAHPWTDDPNVSPRYRNLTWYGLITVIHGTNYPENSFAHMGVHFPTWHRLFQWLFEYGLNHVSGFPVPPITIPYWDWTSPVSTTAAYELMGGDGDPFAENCIVRGPFAWPNFNITMLPDEWVEARCVKRGISTNGIASTDLQEGSHMPSRGDVFESLLALRYASFPWDNSQLGSISFHNVIEGYSSPDNEGMNNQVAGHMFHGMHNIVHLGVGFDMLTLVSPNDPIFFLHHANIDRVLQTWLVESGPTFGTGMPTPMEGSTRLTNGYPAQIRKVRRADDPDCKNIKVTISDFATIGLQVKIGNGSDQAWNDFVTCAYIKDPSGPQIVGDRPYGKRILLGFPAGDDKAAYLTPIPHLYTDPFVFNATIDGQQIVYEEFVLGANVSLKNPTSGVNETWFIAGPIYFNKVLDMGLWQPSWLKKGVLLPGTTPVEGKSFSLHGPFTQTEEYKYNGNQFTALAVTHAKNQKYNRDGWSPAHYNATGYFEAIKNKPLVVRFDGAWWNPWQVCTNKFNRDVSCKSESWNGTDMRQELGQTPNMGGIFGAPKTKAEFTNPYSTEYALVELTDQSCMPLAELLSVGLVDAASEDVAKSMHPRDVDYYCVVQGYFVHPNSSNQAHMKEINERQMGTSGMEDDEKAAVLALAPWPERLNQAGVSRAFTQGMDVSENIYVGARPGGNAQDHLVPFNQFGLAYSPAFFQDVKTASYKELFTAPSR